MLALLFSVQSIANVQATTYAIPIAQLFHDAVGRKLTIVCLVVIGLAQLTASITAFTASSRLFYALARDNGFPAKEKFMALNRFQAPYWGVWTSVLVGCIFSCTYIGSAIAVRAYLVSPNFLIDYLFHSSTRCCPLRPYLSCSAICSQSSSGCFGQTRERGRDFTKAASRLTTMPDSPNLVHSS